MATGTTTTFDFAAPTDAADVTRRILFRSRDAGHPAATPLAAPAAAEGQVESVQRQVIYSGALRLVVVSPLESFASITAIATEAGGYLQESDAKSITVRVPATSFEPVMTRISKLGEVVDRSVKAADVTEEMLDINLRLDTARKSRERLLAHLEKSEKLEDTLKIEAELRRLTTEIEQMEGKLRFLQAQIAMSTSASNSTALLHSPPAAAIAWACPLAG
jgi:hypothetical protein